MVFFEPSFDFVVSTTEEIHQEIEDLVDRLRKVPVAGPSRTGIHAIEAPPPLAKDIESADLTDLIDLITQTMTPKSWDQNGGHGNISPEPNRLALVVSTSVEQHDAVSKLLTMLRRSRYEKLHHQRPWLGDLGAAGSPWLALLAGTDAIAPPALSSLPPARSEDLARLAVRREPAGGTWQVQGATAGGGLAISWRRDGKRLQLELPDYVVQAEGDEAAVALPAFGLVELGLWAETARRQADRQLPWLPHRSNEELARLFQVRAMAGPANEPADPDVVYLHLVPRGLPDEAGIRLEVGFSKKHAQPVRWQSFVDNKPTGRLRFADPAPDGSWRAIELEDTAGQTLATWRLVRTQQSETSPRPLALGGRDLLVLDRRSMESGIDRPFRAAIESIEQSDWAAAWRHLDRSAIEHPRHPLLLLLRAWCYEQDHALGSRELLVAGLRLLAEDPNCAIRLIGDGSLTWLTPAERYEILLAEPAGRRTAADWANLARAAIAAGRPGESLAHARAALTAGQPAGCGLEPCRTLVAILLQLDQAAEAVRTARDWAARPRPPRLGGPAPAAARQTAAGEAAESLAAMAELLAKFGQKEPADRLFVQALADTDLSPLARHQLLRRRAQINTGLPRWQMLREAAELLPERSAQRVEAVDALLAELHEPAQAEILARLAADTKDTAMRGELVWQQMVLTPEAKRQGELARWLYENRRFHAPDLGFLCEIWNAAAQPDRVIAACEKRLRQGKPLAADEVQELAVAYRAAGRLPEARRAETTRVEPPPQPAQPAKAPRGGGMF
jgi:hypothetical protein